MSGFFRPDIFFLLHLSFLFYYPVHSGYAFGGACFYRFDSNRELGTSLKWGVGIISIRPVCLKLFCLFVR